MSWLRGVLFAWMLVTASCLLPARAAAECVGFADPSPVAGAHGRATVVFLADVEQADIVEPGPLGQRVRFRILENFKGELASEETFVFSFTAESFWFVSGQKVLVYASRVDDRMSTQCSRTARADRVSADELATLRTLKQ